MHHTAAQVSRGDSRETFCIGMLRRSLGSGAAVSLAPNAVEAIRKSLTAVISAFVSLTAMRRGPSRVRIFDG